LQFPQAAQIIYFAFNVVALDEVEQARRLVGNAMAMLLADENPPTSSIAGRAPNFPFRLGAIPSCNKPRRRSGRSCCRH